MPRLLRPNQEFQFQGKNICDTFGKDIYAVCKTLSLTNSDELNLARGYLQTFRTCVLAFSPLKCMEKQARRNQIAFLQPNNNTFT